MAHRQRSHERIIQLVREARECTLADLCKRSGLSRTTLRRYLRRLVRQGLVAADRPRPYKGRPTTVYRLPVLAERTTADSYAVLLRDLSALVQAEGCDCVDNRLNDIAKRHAARYSAVRNLSDLGIRVDTARQLLFGTTDTTNVCRVDGGYRFSLRTCPLASLSVEYRDACRAARTVLRELTGHEVEQLEWINRGDPQCTFEIKMAE